ncbi:MAG TPA: hypothetical protein VFA65_06610 [Bryobacteraceae bacterium]|nr:hypothetical protein [Bryobacteraceae bacterium]
MQKCIDGHVGIDEGIGVGRVLTEHINELRFDASVFSSECEAKVASGTFRVFDEIPSLKLVRYFWTDRFLSELLKASQVRRLSCDLLCLLTLDRRPLPSAALFKALIEKNDFVTTQKGQLLLARSLVIAGRGARELGNLILDIPGEQTKRDILRDLFLFQDPDSIHSDFRLIREQSAICLVDSPLCVNLRVKQPVPANCRELEQQIGDASDLEPAAALKFALLIGSHQTLYSCVASDNSGSLLSSLMSLGLFNPYLSIENVLAGYKFGFFKSVEFLDRDVGRLQNIDFPRLRALSTLFALSLVEQLERAPDSGIILRSFTDDTFALFGATEGAARLTLLVCDLQQTNPSRACDRRQIYVEIVKQSFR